MDATALQSLTVELFAAIQLVSGYQRPDALPEVHAVPTHVIQQKVCNSPCRVKAFYHPEWGVHIDSGLDVFDDPFDRSILLHELVHHLQSTSGKFDALPGDCHRRNAEEFEAYEIQNRYLSRQGTSRRALVVGRAHQCGDAG